MKIKGKNLKTKTKKTSKLPKRTKSKRVQLSKIKSSIKLK